MSDQQPTPSMQHHTRPAGGGAMFPHEPHEPVVRLTAEQSWTLLEHVQHARLGTQVGGRVDIVPVNIAAREGRIWFRTAPGTKLAELSADPRVVVQADGVLSDQAWSVQVHGTAREATSSDEVAYAESLRFESWVPTPKHHYVVVEPTEVTGRHFLFGSAPLEETSPTD